MSDFWAKKLGQQAPAAPQQPAAAPVAPAPWWALPSTTPQPQTQPAVPGFSSRLGPQTKQQMDPNAQSNILDLLSQVDYTTTKAKSNDGGRCPECDSGNWMHIRGSLNAPHRCFDCGFNELGYQHELAGISATSEQVPTYTARVQQGTKNDFDPTHIIQHITS